MNDKYILPLFFLTLILLGTFGNYYFESTKEKGRYRTIDPSNYKQLPFKHYRQNILMYGSLDGVNYILIDSTFVDGLIYEKLPE